MIRSTQSPLTNNQSDVSQSDHRPACLESERRGSEEVSGLTSPMRYFAMRHQIEDYVSREALALFAARGWHGRLGQEDWDMAERRLLERRATIVSISQGEPFVRVFTHGYSPHDLAAYIEAGTLYVCGLRDDAAPDRRMRMFSLKMPLPAHLLSQTEIVMDTNAITICSKTNTKDVFTSDSTPRKATHSSHSASARFSAAV